MDISLLNNLWKASFRKSINDENKLVDATASFKQPIFLGNSIFIKSDAIDVNVIPGDTFLCKVFLSDIKQTEYVSIDYDKETIIISSSKKNIRGNIEISLPVLSEVKIDTLNADVYISHIKTEIIDISSDNGDISADIEDDILEGKFSTQNGDITLKLPENIYKLNLKTDAGDLTKKVKSVRDSSKVIKCKTECGDIFVAGNSGKR